MKDLAVSFVIPIYNEEGTILPLFHKIVSTMENYGSDSYEVVFVDDGSNDRSWFEIQKLVSLYEHQVTGLRMRRNFGKALALSAGFQRAQGQIIVTMDGDLQDDPEEIPRFLKKIEEGWDLVSGWKKHRRDPLSKTLPSKLFNLVTAKLVKLPLHDFNCGFKAYRHDVVASIKLYGELHRYTPVLAHALGFKVTEIAVRHHPRQYGISKYGWKRYTRGFLDLLTVLFTTQYLHRPGHLLGGLGLLAGFIGVSSLSYLTILWCLGLGPIGTRPLLSFGVLLTLLSIQLISLGLLGELITNNSNPKPVKNFIADTASSAAVQSRPVTEVQKVLI